METISSVTSHRETIFHKSRVPEMLRRISANEECYRPLVVSIGPYHHGKPELNDMQMYKEDMADRFAQKSGQSKEALYNEVKRVVESNLSDFYDMSSVPRIIKEQLIQILLTDGSFILLFIHCLLRRPQDLKISNPHVAMIKRDLFLLENQIPFQVLRSLTMMSSFIGEGEAGMKLFEDFVQHIRAMPHRRKSCREIISGVFGKLPEESDGPDDLSESAHLLELYYCRFVGSKVVPVNRPPDSAVPDDSWRSLYQNYPAEELVNVGIRFNPSPTSLITNVQFKPTLLSGKIEIPPLSISDSTKSKLLNLVAYEACQGTSQFNDRVTAYVCFMNSLIDHPEDVKELRSQGIIFNSLGSDKEVATLFKEMANSLVPNRYSYMDVKKSIDSHYRSTIKRWILHYRGPVSAFIVKYSFIFGLIISAIKTASELSKRIYV